MQECPQPAEIEHRPVGHPAEHGQETKGVGQEKAEHGTRQPEHHGERQHQDEIDRSAAELDQGKVAERRSRPQVDDAVGPEPLDEQADGDTEQCCARPRFRNEPCRDQREERDRAEGQQREGVAGLRVGEPIRAAGRGAGNSLLEAVLVAQATQMGVAEQQAEQGPGTESAGTQQLGQDEAAGRNQRLDDEPQRAIDRDAATREARRPRSGRRGRRGVGHRHAGRSPSGRCPADRAWASAWKSV